MEFSQLKKSNLEKFDLSKKGSIDMNIIELVNLINDQKCYVTTSSCSGRTIIFENSEQKKKGCNWLFVSHEIVSDIDVKEALTSHNGSAVLKFEPFIMHIRCSTIKDAQKLHSCGLESGFRNSGFTVSKKGGIVLAIRSTLSLEVPLSDKGELLVSTEYITYIINICNEKMQENWKRTEKFHSNFKHMLVCTESNTLGTKDAAICKPNAAVISHCKKRNEKSNNDLDIVDSFCDSFQAMLT